LSIIFFY